MSPEERQLLTQLFDRLRQAGNGPRDREAEDLIAAEMQRQPHAPYVMAQAVIIQEKGLEAATARIRELEERVRELEERAQPAPQQQGGSFLGGLSSIFGGGNAGQPPAPARQSGPWGQPGNSSGRLYDDYARNAPAPQMASQQSGPWGGPATQAGWAQPAAAPAGGGFLRGALTTAAGVAGGVLVADAVRDLFTTHNPGFGNMLGAGGQVAQPVEETIVNNNTYYINDNGSNDDRNTAGNDDNGFQQADYDNSADDGYDDSDFGSGDDSSFA
ncbi:DUF2076 domain-containing protein [Rhizobium paknamense]|uniref:DUF2076 domain-containing protein n=1 Tax=Rhizobium paknamense TaxID=1206817 RepID=A0ABU0I8A1_9HYPH|nr:DUF2076 domain-containing protein [Rhizobium paknamense]MDQ0454465.1 hypothetical protein [Rhizobium paknamense]